MAQISFSDLVNGVIPDASDFNTRFNALKDRFNNGIEADNIANASILTAKIVNDAVTADKIDEDDDFTWTGAHDFAGATVTGLPPVASVLTGTVLPWAGTIATVPTGYLFCNGAAVSQATYANLYAVIGHQYAPDPGSGNFRLPDMRNYFPVGANADSDGAAKSTSNFDTTAYKTKTECNQFYITSDTPSGGGGAALNMAYFNGKHNKYDSAGRVASYPNYVAFAFIIKY